MRPWQVGDILCTCWGYEQTNVEFYEVIRATDKTIWIRELSTTRYDTGRAGSKLPLPGVYQSEEVLERRVGRSGGWVKITSYIGATLWDGQPKEFTSWG